MDGRGKSDSRVVPEKPPNKPGAGRRRWWRKGGQPRGTRPAKRAPDTVPGKARRVSLVACAEWQRTDKEARFTALLHHVDVDRLRAAYRALKPRAAPGVDGVTWEDYGVDLEENLRDLHARVHRGAYRARPSRRVFIPKPDGRLRPLGVARVAAWRIAAPGRPSEPAVRAFPAARLKQAPKAHRRAGTAEDEWNETELHHHATCRHPR